MMLTVTVSTVLVLLEVVDELTMSPMTGLTLVGDIPGLVSLAK